MTRPDDDAAPSVRWSTVLDVGSLRVRVRPGSGYAVEQAWFDVRLDARSGSFAGSVESAWFVEDLTALRAAVVGVSAAVDRVAFVVGGYRSAELRLAGGATAGEEQWVTAWLTPNGDDPHPALEILVWVTPTALVANLAELDALLPGP